MPTYEYTCKKCGENLEVFQSFSAKPLKKHDVCGGELQKVFHARGVVFKGSGWYAKDSKAPASDSTSSSEDNGAKKPKKPDAPKEKSTSDSAKATTASGSSKDKSTD